MTIIGGDEPDTLIQVRNVVPNTPIISDKVLPGDVIVAVNEHVTVGWSHQQLVRLFNSIPTNAVTTIKFCRGYALPEDESVDLVNDLVPDHQSQQEQISNNSSHSQNNLILPSMISHQLITLTINLTKGPSGFGFHFYKNQTNGQVEVLTLTEQGKSNGLLEKDLLLKIDNVDLAHISQNQIIELLSQYPVSSEVSAVIQRRVFSASNEIASANANYSDCFVVLYRNEAGFGFKIKQGTKKTVIGEIVPGGAAELEGSLKKGDEVMTLDGVQTLGMSGEELVSGLGLYFKNSCLMLKFDTK